MLDVLLLRGAIASNGFTEKEIADAAGMSKNTFSSKMNGRGSFNVKQIDCICEKLKIFDPVVKAKIFLSTSSPNRDIT